MVNAHALTQLHDKVHLRPLINDFMQFHDVRVPQVRKRVNLFMDGICCLLILQILFIIRLDRDYVLRHFMLSSSHYRKGALANLETYLKILQIQWLLTWLALFPSINH